MKKLHWFLRAVIVFSVLVTLLASTSALAAPYRGEDQPILIPEMHISAHSGTQATLVVYLYRAQGEPLADATVMLIGDSAKMELSTRTNADGVGMFRLPPGMAEGDHELWVIFPGNEEFTAVTVATTVHISKATSGPGLAVAADSEPLEAARPQPADAAQAVQPPTTVPTTARARQCPRPHPRQYRRRRPRQYRRRRPRQYRRRRPRQYRRRRPRQYRRPRPRQYRRPRPRQYRRQYRRC